MNSFTSETPIGDIAALAPASVRVFEKHRLDYCCGGRASLAEACQGRGLDAATVLLEVEGALDREPAPADAGWTSKPLSALIDYIVQTHHGYLRTELPRLEALLAKVLNAHSAHHGATLNALGSVLNGLKEELESHMMKEEMILFPMIRTLEATAGAGRGAASSHCGSVRNPIRVMEMEHDSAREALQRMRQISGEYTPPADACNTFRALYQGLAEMEADLHQHIHLENHILFPRASRIEA